MESNNFKTLLSVLQHDLAKPNANIKMLSELFEAGTLTPQEMQRWLSLVLQSLTDSQVLLGDIEMLGRDVFSSHETQSVEELLQREDLKSTALRIRFKGDGPYRVKGDLASCVTFLRHLPRFCGAEEIEVRKVGEEQSLVFTLLEVSGTGATPKQVLSKVLVDHFVPRSNVVVVSPAPRSV